MTISVRLHECVCVRLHGAGGCVEHTYATRCKGSSTSRACRKASSDNGISSITKSCDNADPAPSPSLLRITCPIMPVAVPAEYMSQLALARARARDEPGARAESVRRGA